MDIKTAVDAVGVRELSEKVQELGEEIQALSERPIVGNSMLIMPNPKQGVFFCRPACLTLDHRRS